MQLNTRVAATNQRTNSEGEEICDHPILNQHGTRVTEYKDSQHASESSNQALVSSKLHVNSSMETPSILHSKRDEDRAVDDSQSPIVGKIITEKVSVTDSGGFKKVYHQRRHASNVRVL